MGCGLDCNPLDGFTCEDNFCETECGDTLIAGAEECDPTAFEHATAPVAGMNSDACNPDTCTINPGYACDESQMGALTCYENGSSSSEGGEGEGTFDPTQGFPEPTSCSPITLPPSDTQFGGRLFSPSGDEGEVLEDFYFFDD